MFDSQYKNAERVKEGLKSVLNMMIDEVWDVELQKERQ